MLSVVYYMIVDKRFVSNVLPLIVPFFYLAGLLSRLAMHKASQKNSQRFSLVYISLTMFRLMFYLIIMVAYSIFIRHDAYPFMISFFTFYVFFTSYEIIDLHKISHS
jgi:hypothetical protein